MSAQDELERGQLAADVLNNRVYAESLAQVQAEILARWESEKSQSDREWLWALMQASKRFAKVLEETMQTGQLRAKQIEMEQSRTARLRKTVSQF
jgi:hypothetical protein